MPRAIRIRPDSESSWRLTQCCSIVTPKISIGLGAYDVAALCNMLAGTHDSGPTAGVQVEAPNTLIRSRASRLGALYPLTHRPNDLYRRVGASRSNLRGDP